MKENITLHIICLGAPQCTVAFEPEGSVHTLREDDAFRVEVMPGNLEPQIEIAYREDGLSIVEGSDASVRAWNQAGVELRL